MAAKASKIVSRQVALDRGLTTYNTGVPCRRGHLSERWTANSGCVECKREDRQAAGYANDPTLPVRKKRYVERAIAAGVCVNGKGHPKPKRGLKCEPCRKRARENAAK